MQSRESLPLGQERTEDHLGNINTIEKVNHHGGIKGTQQHPAMSPALVSFIHIVGDRPQNGQEWLSQQNESEPTVDDNVEYTQPSDPTVTAAAPPPYNHSDQYATCGDEEEKKPPHPLKDDPPPYYDHES